MLDTQSRYLIQGEGGHWKFSHIKWETTGDRFIFWQYPSGLSNRRETITLTSSELISKVLPVGMSSVINTTKLESLQELAL